MSESSEFVSRTLILGAMLVAVLALFRVVSPARALEGGRSCG